MFCVLDQLHGRCKLLVTLSASCVRFHFLRELTTWIAAVHLVARNAGDSLTGFTCTKAFRTCHTLILIRCKPRRAVAPETGRKTDRPDFVFALHRPVKFK